MLIRCLLLKHSPDRRRTWHDGRNFRADCRRCGVPMVRDFHARWHVVAAGADYGPGDDLPTSGG